MAGPTTSSDGRIRSKGPQPGGAPGNGGGPPTEAKPMSMMGILNSPEFKAQIERAVPKMVDPDRMLRIVLTAIRVNPGLTECTQQSFFGCILQSAQLGLEANTPMGHCYLIPYKNRKRNITECQLIVGYQGQIELCMRSGRVTGITANVVRKGDLFEYEYGLNPTLKHKPSELVNREDQPITHVYGVGRVRDSDPVFEVLSFAQVMARKARSASASSGSSPWTSDPEAMIRKTAVRALFKWLPKSAEMARAEVLDVRSDQGSSQAPMFDMTVQQGLQDLGMTAQIVDTEGEEELAQPAAAALGEGSGQSLSDAGFDPLTGEVAPDKEMVGVR